ncbi:HAD family phosphatase [Patescibacteria group bacterium]|nr:HAD family phosphatase [Patescibacteria group bacterium]MBU1703330.1 HAD family phosphatase [Patescibacteria group bacterium]MBU1954360.1 HAD family phosphatase [Patescibacteria group bacterium]
MINALGYIFDLDGTLAISQHFHYIAYNAVLIKHGIKYTRDEDIATYAGQGSEKIFPKIFAANGITLSAEETGKLVMEKREAYQNLIEKAEIFPVPGVKDFLETIKDRKKIIATGNRKLPSEIILKKTGLQGYFSEMVTVEDVKEPKPSPETFLLALGKLQINPDQCIIFEDAINGVHAAKASGIECIGITTSFSAGELLEAGAKRAIGDYRELLTDN